MPKFYADEQFPKGATIVLRSLGHDVLTVQEAEKANQRIPDDEVLAFACEQGRAVLTLNRYDFIQLHRQSSDHAGIITCTENSDLERLAVKIHEAVSAVDSLQGQLIRIYRDAKK
jgi:predicted nuclease of predicted toxin-antitoxin system